MCEPITQGASAAEGVDAVDVIVNKVIEKIKVSNDIFPLGNNGVSVRYIRSNNGGRRPGNPWNTGRRKGGQRRNYRPNQQSSRGNLKCRSCQSTEHLLRTAPYDFARLVAVGAMMWNTNCPNYDG